jgi:hypothetical protein
MSIQLTESGGEVSNYDLANYDYDWIGREQMHLQAGLVRTLLRITTGLPSSSLISYRASEMRDGQHSGSSRR